MPLGAARGPVIRRKAAAAVDGVSFVAETSAVVTGDEGTNQSVSLPGTPAENDIVLVVVGSDSDLNLSTDGVQTAGYSDLYRSTSSSPGTQVAWKRMGATPDTEIEIGRNGFDMAVIIQIWRGVDTTTAIDATPVAADANAGMPDPAAYTTVTDEARVFAAYVLDDDPIEASVTAPTGYDHLIAKEANAVAGTSAVAMMASRELATAGTEDPGAFGGDGDDSWEGVTFALRPA